MQVRHHDDLTIQNIQIAETSMQSWQEQCEGSHGSRSVNYRWAVRVGVPAGSVSGVSMKQSKCECPWDRQSVECPWDRQSVECPLGTHGVSAMGQAKIVYMYSLLWVMPQGRIQNSRKEGAQPSERRKFEN